MKMTYLLGLMFLLSFSCIHAAVITVDNSANSSAPYSDFISAQNAALPGDTIHLIGSNTSYGNLLIDKQITLIGSGYNPPNQLGLPTRVNFLALGQNNVNSDVSGTVIMGLEASVITCNGNGQVNNIRIERCRVINNLSMTAGNCMGWIIQHNILNSISIANNALCSIRNNIITTFISTSNEPSVTISNNIFASNLSGATVFANVQHATITNNIFYRGRSPQGCTLCTFNNNITFQTGNNTLPYGNNSGSNNLVGTDPQFTNAPNGTFQLDYDYRLAAASAGNNAGTDNTDIGIYGGTQPFPIGGPAPYLTSAPPRLPQVLELNLQNTNLPQGSPLRFQVVARKQN